MIIATVALKAGYLDMVRASLIGAILANLSREAGNFSGQYLANTVLFAAVLFFAGTSGKFEQPRIRLLVLTLGGALFGFVLARTLLSPMA